MAAFATIHAPRPEWLGRAEPEPALEPELPIVDAHSGCSRQEKEMLFADTARRVYRLQSQGERNDR